jgi:hypothetical protein
MSEIKLEIKKIFLTSTVLFSICYVLLFLFDLGIYSSLKQESSMVINSTLFPFFLMIYLAYISANILGIEFSTGCSKIIFQNKKRMTKLVLFKLLAVFLVLTAFIIIDSIFNWLSLMYLQQAITFSLMLFQRFVIYYIYAISILSFGIFVTAITSSRVWSFVINFVFFFVLTQILYGLRETPNIQTQRMVTKFIHHSFFSIPDVVLVNQSWTSFQVIQMIIFSGLFTWLTIYLLKRRSY